MSRLQIALWTLSFALVVSGSAAGQAGSISGEPNADTAQPQRVEITEKLRKQIRSNPDAALKNHLKNLYSYSPDGIVTWEDVRIVERYFLSQNRAQAMVPVLSFDLNGDGKIIPEEYNAIKVYAKDYAKSKLDLALINFDADGDGSLSYQELTRFYDDKAVRSNELRAIADRNPMMFDLDLDGVVDSREVSEAIDGIASSVD